jgi:hypothetical protein
MNLPFLAFLIIDIYFLYFRMLVLYPICVESILYRVDISYFLDMFFVSSFECSSSLVNIPFFGHSKQFN